jgi:hypothetical protein
VVLGVVLVVFGFLLNLVFFGLCICVVLVLRNVY